MFKYATIIDVVTVQVFIIQKSPDPFSRVGKGQKKKKVGKLLLFWKPGQLVVMLYLGHKEILYLLADFCGTLSGTSLLAVYLSHPACNSPVFSTTKQS